ncbi:MAG TPA: FAD-binding oxidoreductase [Polyangiaceae bacterium]
MPAFPAPLPLADFPLPNELWTTEPAELEEFGKDWTKVFPPRAGAVVFPRTTAHVSTVLRWANERGVSVVPSGGRTGLAGGAVAKDGELVLSLSRMGRMDPVDVLGQTVRVQAGAVTEAVHQHCAGHGLTWPVDFASKGSSQVGGNIATNAGGVKVIRYGLTRQWVLGLEVVLANGDVLELGGGLEKNNTGIDLRQLFIGSEGILGVVTEATLKLARLPAPSKVLLFAVADLAAVLRLFREIRASAFTVSAYEFFTRPCLDRLLRHRKLRDPFGAPSSHYVLVELEDPGEALDAVVAHLFEHGFVQDGTMAQHASEAAELWALREGISESLSATGMPHKNDIALPIADLKSFCGELDGVFAQKYPGWEICLFGHIGDGNLHVNVMKPDELDKAAFLAETHAADLAMFELVKKHHGSISAEHGIGLLKKEFLSFSRSHEEIALMRAMKGVLDPKGTLNPGKVL